MNIFIDEIDLHQTITYKEIDGEKQDLHTKGGFEIKSLEDYRTYLCNLLDSAIAYEVFVSGKLTHKEIETAIEKVKRNGYGVDWRFNGSRKI